MRIATLSSSRAGDLAPNGALLFIDRAAPGALKLLREVGTSYVTRAGEWHLVEPPGLFIVKPPDRVPSLAPSPNRSLAKGAARIARWLILHAQDQSPTIGELARATQLSNATASRSVRQLAERDLVTVVTQDDARRRSVTLRDPTTLLDALADDGPWRRARRTTWDIGVHSADEALSLIRRSADSFNHYAIGELAGAALIHRVIEPAGVVLWVPKEDIAHWQTALIGHPARPAPGRVSVRVAPDPVVLNWGSDIEGLRVADPVQLYIDCRHAGERAIDAAEALREQVLKP